jgi:Domain of unknown function (DUF4272)
MNMLDAHNFDFKLNIRHPYEVAQRVLAILAVLDRLHTTTAAPALEWVYAYGIDQHFSAAEKKFYFSKSFSEEDRETFGWLTESLAVLLWAMGYLDTLPALHQRFELAAMPYLDNITSSTAQFLVDACLRHTDALLIAEEQHYQAHWQVMNAESSSQNIFDKINPDIIYERRYAFSWLVGMEEGEN